MPRVLVFTISLLASAVGHAAGDLTIILPPQAIVHERRVLLVDVADVRGAPAALVERLRAVDLGPAPLPYLPRRLSRQFLEQRLRREGLARQAIHWSGQLEVRVVRKTTRVPRTRLAEEATAHLRKSLPGSNGRPSIELESSARDLLVLCPLSELCYIVTLPSAWRPASSVPVQVAVSHAGRVLARAHVLLKVRVGRPRVVASRPRHEQN